MKSALATILIPALSLVAFVSSASADSHLMNSIEMTTFATKCRDVAIYAARGEGFTTDENARKALDTVTTLISSMEALAKDSSLTNSEHADVVDRLGECTGAMKSVTKRPA